MKSLDAFLTHLMPMLPGCPVSLAEQHLVKAARDFCHQTQIVRITTDPVAVRAEVSQYDVELPVDTEVVQVISAWYGTATLRLVGDNEIDTPLAYVDQVGSEKREPGTPTTAYIAAPLTISLDPPPMVDAPKMLTLRVSTKPSLGATMLDDTLYFDWLEALVHGAAATISAIPGQAFSSDIEATKAMSLYRYYLGRAKLESRRGRVRADMRVQMRPFA